jgi:hypothetical protein
MKREYTKGVMRSEEEWLIELWKEKASEWREAGRMYAEAARALLRSFLVPGRELHKLESRLVKRRHTREDVVLHRTGKWFALLEKLRIRPSCLVRSLTLASVLREEGHDAHLVFGVRSDNGDMEGHCWVAVEERPVTESPTSFKELKDE